MSRTVVSLLTRTRSIAPTSPSASAIAVATVANEPAPDGISSRIVTLYEAEGFRAMDAQEYRHPTALVAGRRPARGPGRVRRMSLYHQMEGEGAPLVLIHAGICDSRMWDAQWPEFADGHRALRYDMR